jgi:UDP-2,3-diacylglucosamine pyrophosphatase LpxH
MLVIISDLHLGDGTCAKSIPPSAFYLFADRLRELAYHASWRRDNTYHPIESIDLVLLGDILDPQHSTRWLDTTAEQPNYTRPWTDPNAPNYAIKLREVTRAMLEHNAEGISILRHCAEGKMIHIPPGTVQGTPDFSSSDRVILPVRIHYTVGNHDWHYRLPGAAFNAIRQEIIEAFGLSNPTDNFPWEIEELEPLNEIFQRYQVYGRHGDQYDKFNYDPTRGRNSATLGDVFAMEVLNRYPVEVARQLGTELPMSINDCLRKLTNVRPALATPLWISGQIKQHAQDNALEGKLKAIWDQVGEEFLAVDFVRQADKAFKFDTVDALEVLLHISRRTSFNTINEIIAWVRKKMWGGEISFTKFALQEKALQKALARYIVYGHTHHHEVVPLDSDGIPPTTSYQIYMNSGTWHSYYTLTAKDPKEQKFVPYQMLTYLIIYHDDQRGGRHFEAWSGAFA